MSQNALVVLLLRGELGISMLRKYLFKLLPIFLLLSLTLWAAKGVFRYSVNDTHDGNHHIARSYDVVQTSQEGHFPLRWAGSLNYDCGVPIFNFFYPLIYYLVIPVNYVVGDVIQSLKIIDFATFFIGTVFFYLWLKRELKETWPAFVGAILYLYAPYRFLLVYVRGSPEFMAYAILPVVLYFIAVTFSQDNIKRFGISAFISAVFGGLLTISHNFTVMFLMPIIFIYLVFKIYKSQWLEVRLIPPRVKFIKDSGKKFFLIILSFLSYFGLGAFFILPAFLEQKFTKLEIASFIYKEHFPELWQVIRSKWGYFYSASGTDLDGMSFMLGYAHWIVLGLVSLWLVITLAKVLKLGKRSLNEFFTGNAWILIYLSLSALFIFLLLPISLPVWEALPILQRIQFPWRILGICVFAISALFPFWIVKFKKRKFFYFVTLLFVGALSVIGNRNHLMPEPVLSEELDLYENFDRLHWHRHSTTTFNDDIVASSAPSACNFGTPLVSQDDEEILHEVVDRGNTYGLVNINYPGDSESDMVFGLSYFPGAYDISLNGEDVKARDCHGMVCIQSTKFKKGVNLFKWKIVQTGPQQISNLITLSFVFIWIVVLYFILTGKNPKKNHIILALLLTIFMFFRFYNIEQRIGFGWDQERDAWAASEILGGDIKLIGPRVLADTGFFLPPYFFYILTPFYLLGNGSPFSLVLFLVFYNLLFFVTSYELLRRIFSKKFSYIFLAIWALNPLSISMDTVVWNPIFVPLLFLVLLFLVHKTHLSKKSRALSFLTGAVFGLGISFHVQLSLAIAAFARKKFLTFKKVTLFLLGTLMMFLPG